MASSIITGEIGAGKTTLIETFLRELEKDVLVAQINQTQVSAIEFLQIVLVQFGFKPFKMKKAELLATLNNFLIEQYAAGRKVLLIIDEAQNLSCETLEEIRLLSGIETTKEKVLRIILAGQPELNEKLDSPELMQLAQRVRLRFHLDGALARGYARLRRCIAWRSPAPMAGEIFAEDCFRYLSLHGRRTASDQFAVRYGDDGRLHRRPGSCDAGGSSSPRSPNCAGPSSSGDCVGHRASAGDAALGRHSRAARDARRRRAPARRHGMRWRAEARAAAGRLRAARGGCRRQDRASSR